MIDETGAKIDRINWGIQYCGGINQLGQFVGHPCTWTKRAVCVTNNRKCVCLSICLCVNVCFGLKFLYNVKLCMYNNLFILANV